MITQDGLATARAVAECFRRLHGYYAQQGGLAAESAANAERAVSRQYSGRVAFELLQNALDRARERVALSFDGQTLLVANDGRPLRCDPTFEPGHGLSDGNRLSDFHALCSMHTSSKNPDDDNGNKGVGFRSTFSVSAQVSIWSRLDEGAWWGVRLLRGPDAARWNEAAATPEVQAAFARFGLDAMRTCPLRGEERRPSYHCLLPLFATVPPGESTADWAVTVVELGCDSEHSIRSVNESIASLRMSHLEFVGLRARPVVRVEIDGAVMSTQPTLGLIGAWSVDAAADPSLFEMACAAGLDMKRSIGGAVRWSAPEESAGLVYCYLATAVPCAFTIDLHADLQTGIDRKHLEVRETETVGKYNRELLLRGLRVHFAKIDEDGLARDDLWRMLDPGEAVVSIDERKDPVRHLLVSEGKRLLFGDDASPARSLQPAHWARWARRAARYFAERPRPAVAFEQFWRATENWITAFYPRGYAYAKRAAEACLAALRDAGAQVIPITRTSDGRGEQVEAVVPPVHGKLGVRSDSRLFHDTSASSSDAKDALLVPAAVARRDRRMTAWTFPEAFCRDGRLIGSVSFERAALLQELRQLPTREGDGLGLTEDEQVDVLVFAARLFQLPVKLGSSEARYAGRAWPPGWRADHESEDVASAGRAVATLFLRRLDGQWAPARQLRRDELDPALLDRISARVSGLDLEQFLTFLGVATWIGGLRLIESGDAGVVEPRACPPSLCDPSTTPIGRLGIPLSIDSTEGLVERLDAAWAWTAGGTGWLAEFARREALRPERLGVFDALGAVPCFPVGDGGARAPVIATANVARVAPRQLALQPAHGQRLDKLVWRVPASTASAGWLRAAGARSLDERLSDPALASDLLRELALSYPDPARHIDAHHDLRFLLTEAFRRALDTVVKHADPAHWARGLPLLSESPHPRRLGWARPEETFVATDKGEREVIRRLAPDLPLLVAVIGSKLVKGTSLSARVIEVATEVGTDDAREDDAALAVRAELESLLAGLLALAETSRAYDRAVDPAEVAERWRATIVLRARDVWRVYTLRADGLDRELTDGKDTAYGVLHTIERRASAPVGDARIYYDVAPAEVSPRRPPLAWFAEAIADILLDRNAEHDWRAALSEFDAGGAPRFHAYLQRRGVGQELIDAMETAIAPLPEAELAPHRAKVAEVLGRFEVLLVDPQWTARSARTLSPPRQLDLEAAIDVTEAELNRALEAAEWSDAARRFVPRVDVTSAHLDAWRQWERADHRRLRVLKLGHARRSDRDLPRDPELLAPSSELARKLDDYVRAQATRLRFSPDAAARAWCGVAEPAGGDWLPPHVEFAPVTRSPSVAVFVHVASPTPRPSARVLMPLTQEERNADDAVKATKGDQAEAAFLRWVVESTQQLIDQHGDRAWEALRLAVPGGSRVHHHLDQARTRPSPEALAKALWISHYWGSAGYDVLGLEARDAGVVPVRYEVKALPDAPRVRVFISTNELAVYRSTRSAAGRDDLRVGDWRLVGVRRNGAALDLTEALDPIRDADSGGLATLARDGFAPDALQMVVDLTPQGIATS